MVSKRINDRSSNREEFEKVAQEYNNALKRSGHKEKIVYTEKSAINHEEKKKNRRRNITWYNPPYCESVATKVGKKFKNLIKQHFPKENPLSKIFNKNSINLSYSCLPNMEQIINIHNRKIMEGTKKEEDQPCNCRNECPTKGVGCRRKNVVYEATVTSEQDCKVYVGLTSSEFKKRYANHKTDFKYEKKKNSTALASHVWDIKKKDKQYEIEWKIIDATSELKNGQKQCRLCLKESLAILNRLKEKKNNCLNQRNEILNTCRHGRTFLLKYWCRGTSRSKTRKKELQTGI